MLPTWVSTATRRESARSAGYVGHAATGKPRCAGCTHYHGQPTDMLCRLHWIRVRTTAGCGRHEVASPSHSSEGANV